jgi:hypothetical protein
VFAGRLAGGGAQFTHVSTLIGKSGRLRPLGAR